MASDLQIALSVAAAPALQERGCVQTIGLEQIKAELGPRWDKRKETVWAHLEGLLSQKLSSTDYFTRIDDISFLVSMPLAQADEAQIFCLRIAHALHESLLGPCESQDLRIARVIEIRDETLVTAPLEGASLANLAQRASIQAGQLPPHQPLDELLEAGPSPVDYGHRFLPFWDAQKEAITTWRCISSCGYSSVETTSLSQKQKLAVTLSRIQNASNTLTRHLRTGDRFIIWIPLSYDLITSSFGRMEIAGLCRSLGSELRPYIVFEVCDLPHGVPQSRLNELVSSLRPFCRGVAALLPGRIASYSAYVGTGLLALGLSYSSVGGIDTSDEVFRLSAAVKKQKMTSFLLDVPNEKSLQMARAMGINLISSPLIGSATIEPQPIRRVSALMLAS